MNTELELLERELNQVLADLASLTLKVQSIMQRVSELRTVEVPTPPVEPEEIDLEPIALSPEEMKFAYGPADSDPEGDVEEEVADAELTQQPEPDAEISPETTELHPVTLTVNDRYRFRREIFNGDDAAMKLALDLIATLPDMEAVEEYLQKELHLASDSEIYPEFVAAIRLSR